MQNFWNTVSKYPIFVFGTLLGVFLNALKPLAPLMKNPVTAIALIGLALGSLAFVTLTLRAMLGLSAV
jgi:NADH:ubiquinone oxidoreductase subunit 2 (subunit N)